MLASIQHIRGGKLTSAIGHVLPIDRFDIPIQRCKLRSSTLVAECHIRRAGNEIACEGSTSLEILDSHSLRIETSGLVIRKVSRMLSKTGAPISLCWLFDRCAVKLATSAHTEDNAFAIQIALVWEWASGSGISRRRGKGCPPAIRGELYTVSVPIMPYMRSSQNIQVASDRGRMS